MPEQFHNPYHFVPLASGPMPGAVDLQKTKKGVSRIVSKDAAHIDHGSFLPLSAKGFHSGRIVCRLEVLELLAVGGSQSSGSKSTNAPREVELFQLDGEPALPGNSLRGMLSSLAEAASGGALRILEDRELSLSAGPKNRKPLGQLFDYFRSAGHTDLLPLRHGDGRKTLSLAEGLFGTVEILPEGTSAPRDWNALAIGSRLRVSHARLHGPAEHASGQVTQILDSPKPPSPAFYFKDRKTPGGFIPKLALSKGKHEPQGRKFYLHRKRLEDADWISQNDRQKHQKAGIAPLSSGVFWFHLDFFNLTRLELELLCYALRPSKTFRHKLGMGKALGLGKVEILPMGLFLSDRRARYADDPLDAPRYAQVFQRVPPASEWPESYAAERDAPGTEPPAPLPETLATAWRERVGKDFPTLLPALDAIEQIGDPDRIVHPVHYPQVAGPRRGSPAFENAHFKWFVQNEKQGHEALRPLPADALPSLSRGKDSAASRKPKRPDRRRAASAAAHSSLAVGTIVEATVAGHLKSQKGWIAAFLDIDGQKGFLHVSQIGGGSIEDIRSELPKGNRVRVKITALKAPNGSSTLQCTMKGVPPA